MSSNRFEGVMGAINNLKQALENIQRKLPPYLIGMYGELTVAAELEKRFPNAKIEYKGGQSKSDITLTKGGKSVNIEVKTSRFKKEDYGEGYGFALHIKKCEKGHKAFFRHPTRGQISGDFCYLDYLICVAVNSNDLRNPSFYIFSRDELDSFAPQIENKSKRFSNAPYRILIPIKPDPKQRGILYNDFDLKLVKDRDRFKNRWGKIKINAHI